MNDDSMEVTADNTSAQEFQAQVANDKMVTTHFQDRRFDGRDVREVLRQLFYYIHVDLGITSERWEQLVNFHVAKTATAEKTPTEIRSAIKKNFIRAKQMTVAMFCRALKILPIVRVRFGVTLVFANNRATSHGIWFKINDAESLRGLDQSIGDVQGPVRYMTELSARQNLDSPIQQQEGDNDIIKRLQDLADRP